MPTVCADLFLANSLGMFADVSTSMLEAHKQSCSQEQYASCQTTGIYNGCRVRSLSAGGERLPTDPLPGSKRRKVNNKGGSVQHL